MIEVLGKRRTTLFLDIFEAWKEKFAIRYFRWKEISSPRWHIDDFRIFMFNRYVTVDRCNVLLVSSAAAVFGLVHEI